MEWEVEELYKLSKIQPDILEVVLKELWQKNPALYKSVIINAYLNKKIKLGKAAELIGVHRLELQNELREKGVPIRGISKEDAIAEVEAYTRVEKEAVVADNTVLSRRVSLSIVRRIVGKR